MRFAEFQMPPLQKMGDTDAFQFGLADPLRVSARGTGAGIAAV